MGTITLKVRELAEKKGITSPFALARETGLNYAICHRLWSAEPGKQVALETIARLCDGLKVKPAQLLEYTPD